MTTDSTDPPPTDTNETETEAEVDFPPLKPGMIVVDREIPSDERDPAVVMSRPPVLAEQWDLDHVDRTLAADNPDYPADARPVIAIYRERFEDTEEYNPIPVHKDEGY